MQQTISFLSILLLIHILFTAAYLLWGIFAAKHSKNGRFLFVIRALIIFLCPVTGILYFVCSNLFHRLFFHNTVDLSDVIFNKEKIRQVEKSDIERERNFAPIEETIAVGDYKNQRQLMMNVLRSDYRESLGSISLALNSADSEVSHYAASALRDELGSFRNIVQQMHHQLQEPGSDTAAVCLRLMNYMYPVLKQNIFPVLEYKNYVQIFANAFTTVFNENPAIIKPVYYEWLTELLIAIKEFDAAAQWCQTAKQELSGMLTPYKCLLRLYYNIKDSRRFLETMEELKQSDIPIDNDTLETFRIFS